VAYY